MDVMKDAAWNAKPWSVQHPSSWSKSPSLVLHKSYSEMGVTADGVIAISIALEPDELLKHRVVELCGAAICMSKAGTLYYFAILDYSYLSN